MEVGSVERMLRETPGVLDCSVSDEGIAVVVHPEVDPRMLELRIQAALAGLGDRRPLLVVGGMSTAGGTLPVGSSGTLSQAHRPGMRPPRLPRARSSMPILGFAVLVVAAVTLVPLAGRSDRGVGGSAVDGQVAAPAPASAPSGPSGPTAVRGESGARPTFGSLPVVDEALSAVAGPFLRSAAIDVAAFRVAGRALTASSPPPPPAASPTGTSVGVAQPSVTPPAPPVAGPGRSAAARAEKVDGRRGKGPKRAELAAAGLGDDDRGKQHKGPKPGKGKGRGAR